MTITIRAGISCLVLEDLDQTVKDDCNCSAKQRANPVDPMVTVECTQDDIGTKGASRVQGSTGKEDAFLRELKSQETCIGLLTSQLGNEKSQANANGSKESGPVLLRCEHEYAEDELKGQKYFNEQASNDRCV